MNRSRAMPAVSRVRAPIRGLRRVAPAQAVSRLHRRSGWERSAAKGLLRTCRGEAWPIAASTAVLSMRRAASAEETRPLRNQVRVVRALAAMRGDKRIVYRAEWEASWVDMDTSLRIGPGTASA